MERHAEFLDLLVGDRVQLAQRSGEDQRAGAEICHLKTVERVDELVTGHDDDGLGLQAIEVPTHPREGIPEQYARRTREGVNHSEDRETAAANNGFGV